MRNSMTVNPALSSPGLSYPDDLPVLFSQRQWDSSVSTCQYYGAGVLLATTFWGWQVNVEA
jgi:hypothetical protein